jgi:hypothetical protein
MNKSRNKIAIVSDAFFLEYTRLIRVVSKSPRYAFNLSDKEFIKSMTLLTPQSYGPRIQKRIAEKLGFSTIRSKDDCGDLCDNSTGKKYEVKCSILTPTNSCVNLVQLRLWQPVDYYLCIAYDIRDIRNFKTYVFVLTHDEMKAECKQCRASSAHGTATANVNNKNIELRMSFLVDSSNSIFARWLEKYHKPDFIK